MNRPECTYPPNDPRRRGRKHQNTKPAIASRRASDILTETLSSTSVISTTISFLDNHPCIKGLRPKTVTEFVTNIGTNQADLCFRILAKHLCENEDSNVIYLTGKNTFSMDVVGELIHGYGRSPDITLKRVLVYDVITLSELLNVLNIIRQKHSNMKYCLLIIDGINACHKSSKQDHFLHLPVMTKVFQNIKQLACLLNFTVLIATELKKEKVSNEFTAIHHHDERHKQFIDVRVFLEKSQDVWTVTLITPPVYNDDGNQAIG